jgi:hypothetical protein
LLPLPPAPGITTACPLAYFTAPANKVVEFLAITVANEQRGGQVPGRFDSFTKRT